MTVKFEPPERVVVIAELAYSRVAAGPGCWRRCPVPVAALVRDGGASLSRTEERLVEMTNGCIRCTLRDDLLEEVDRLARAGRFDYLLIESSGCL